MTLLEILNAKEGHHFEFKEAKNRFGTKEAAEYLCALSNHGGGRLVLGVTDKRPRKVVGSNACPQPESTIRHFMDKLDSYVVTQLNAPDGFRLGGQNSQTVFVQRPAETYALNFTNEPYSGLIIQNLDGYNGDPLPGVRFRIDSIGDSGNVLVGEHVTDANGRIEITGILGSFSITQLDVPNGWEFDAQPTRIAHVNTGAPTLVTFHSPRMGSLEITLADGGGNPLPGGRFEVRRQNGQLVGEFVTPVSGMVSIPNLGSGWFTVEQFVPPSGFVMADTGRSVEVAANTVARANFVNVRQPSLVIEKVCTDGSPLAGAEFEVRTLAGALVHREVTNNGCIISIAMLDAGAFTITETRAPQGFVITEPSRTVTIVAGETLTERFVNHRAPSLIIEKVDTDGNPLAGAEFEIRRLNGELTRRVVTGSGGTAVVDILEPGAYHIIETRAPAGHAITEPARAIEIVAGETRVERFVNPRLPTFVISKVDGDTNRPLQGVVFEVAHFFGTGTTGERLRNPQNGTFEFVSDAAGIARIGTLTPGTYIITETRPLPGFRALPGFVIDEEVIAFNIDASARQRAHVLTVGNTPAAGLLIIAADAQTGRPLAGIEIEVRHADGRLVTGQMPGGNQPSTPANSPQLAANGNFVTDANGRINLNHLAPGVYHVRVAGTFSGYQSDTDVHVVTVTAGQQAVLELRIASLAGLRLLHIDAITGAGIFNVEFMVFDHNGRAVGNFYTDNNGVIDFGAILAPGRYTIRMTRPAPGYARDDVPRTVEFVAGRITEIVWEAIPIAGQLQILKLSGDANQHNGLPAGTPLAGAIFEIFEARTGNLVDRIVSNERGMAVSRPLPLGRYIAVEVAAPAFYMINLQEIHFEIEHESQIVRVTFPNFSANMGVTIRKTGPQEAMQGHNIVYEIPVIRNDSTTPLADFFWRDVLPTNAVRADRLITGTYNHALRFRVLATTSRGNEIVVADNLSTLTNNVVELRPVHLGLLQTSMSPRLYFSSVKPRQALPRSSARASSSMCCLQHILSCPTA